MSGGIQQVFWIAFHDLKGLWRERGALWLLAAAVALAVHGLGQGADAQAARAQAAAQAERQAAQAVAAARVAAADYFADPQAPRHAGLPWWRVPFDIRGLAFREHVDFASRPALAGGALAIGASDLLPSTLRVRSDSWEATQGAYEIEHPARLAAGRFDLLFFVVYVWPLVLLALGCTVLTLDRELKRLPLLGLQGVGPARLLLAQGLARMLAATGVLVGAVALVALGSGAVAWTAPGRGALLQWSGIVLLYSLFWSAVVALACACARQRVTAAFAGFGAWVVLAVLLPTLLPAAIAATVPMPSREAYVEAMRDAGDRVDADRVQMLARFYDEHPQWRPVHTALDQVSPSVARIARQQEQERLLAPVQARFEAARAERDRRFERWSMLSPVSLAQEALSRLAGNDAARHRRFLAEVAAHHAALRSFFQARLQEAALRDESSPCPRTCRAGFGFEDFDAIPRFRAGPGSVQPTPLPVGALLAWALLCLVGAALLARWFAQAEEA